jgi:hypothetical protein
MFCNYHPAADTPLKKLDIALLDEVARDSLLDVALELKFAFGDLPIVKKPYFGFRECQVMGLRELGLKTRDIAIVLRITPQRITQITNKAKRKIASFNGNKVTLELAKETSRRSHERWEQEVVDRQSRIGADINRKEIVPAQYDEMELRQYRRFIDEAFSTARNSSPDRVVAIRLEKIKKTLDEYNRDC